MYLNLEQCGKLNAAGEIGNHTVTSSHSTLHLVYHAIQCTTTHPDRLPKDYDSGTAKDILNTGNELPGGVEQQYPNVTLNKI